MEKKLNALILVLLSLSMVACTQVSTVETSYLPNAGNASIIEGTVTSIEHDKTAASGSKQAIGTLIGVGVGALFGSGKGKAAAAVAGGVIGDAATNHFYGDQIESMTIHLDNDQYINVKVKGNPFNQGDRVKVSMQGGHVSGIVHDYD